MINSHPTRLPLLLATIFSLTFLIGAAPAQAIEIKLTNGKKIETNDVSVNQLKAIRLDDIDPQFRDKFKFELASRVIKDIFDRNPKDPKQSANEFFNEYSSLGMDDSTGMALARAAMQLAPSRAYFMAYAVEWTRLKTTSSYTQGFSQRGALFEKFQDVITRPKPSSASETLAHKAEVVSLLGEANSFMTDTSKKNATEDNNELLTIFELNHVDSHAAYISVRELASKYHQAGQHDRALALLAAAPKEALNFDLRFGIQFSISDANAGYFRFMRYQKKELAEIYETFKKDLQALLADNPTIEKFFPIISKFVEAANQYNSVIIELNQDTAKLHRIFEENRNNSKNAYNEYRKLWQDYKSRQLHQRADDLSQLAEQSSEDISLEFARDFLVQKYLANAKRVTGSELIGSEETLRALANELTNLQEVTLADLQRSRAKYEAWKTSERLKARMADRAGK